MDPILLAWTITMLKVGTFALILLSVHLGVKLFANIHNVIVTRKTAEAVLASLQGQMKQLPVVVVKDNNETKH